ncbi:hypothetical protein G5V59_07375 [Nocardioides sp. W3-2-3]|uniref:hypothetical protein n=1 Tax=Nocardioides convexus TaxID=2712224 RepID=UPI002418245E|nr:hypothetical protein [Nocardioides convexus]NHA00065.1 hypothetical protein [Nocardioides convexus]
MQPTVRRGALVGLLALAGALLTLPASADQAPSGVPASVVRAAVPQVPPGCRPRRNPPPTEYGVVARIESGSIDAGVLKIEDMDVSICGVLRLVRSGESACPVSTQAGDSCRRGEGQRPARRLRHHPRQAARGAGQHERQRHPVHRLLHRQTQGGFRADLNVALQGRARLFGLQCVIPFTGVAKAVITGPLLSPAVRGDRDVEGRQTSPSRRSPTTTSTARASLPTRIDRLVRLPITKVPIDLKAKITVYQDPA